MASENLGLSAETFQDVDLRFDCVGIGHEEISSAVEHARRVSGELHGARSRPPAYLGSNRFKEARLSVEEELDFAILYLDVDQLLQPLRFEWTFHRGVAKCAVDERRGSPVVSVGGGRHPLDAEGRQGQFLERVPAVGGAAKSKPD